MSAGATPPDSGQERGSSGWLWLLPFLAWVPMWRERGTVRADLLAGLTGAVVVLPQGLAFATLAGMPPQYGLYAAMVPCLVAALFGSSRLMVTGPANAISLTTMALIAPLEYVSLVITLAFLVGAVQVLLGLARAGRLVDLVPHSVIVGFTAGAAVLIMASQLGPLFGIDLPRGLSAGASVLALLGRLAQTHWHALLSGLATIVAIRLWMPLNRTVPAMLVGVVAGAGVAWLLQTFAPGPGPLKSVPALPGALPAPSMPDLSAETVRSLFAATLVMTLLGLTEAVAIARAIAARGREQLDGSREFIGQGLANVAGSFFSAYPTSGSFNRSGVNVTSGARTPLAAASAAIFLVVLLLFVSPLARFLPFAVIAGLLFVVAWGLIDRGEIARIWREEPLERAPLVVTAIATVTLSLEWAILLGLLTALLARRLLRR
jgi:SulP family sulfate permease